jgi:hypothetical protein
MAQVKRKHASSKHIRKLIKEEVSFFNGWLVEDKRVDDACQRAAVRILRYLGLKEQKCTM